MVVRQTADSVSGRHRPSSCLRSSWTLGVVLISFLLVTSSTAQEQKFLAEPSDVTIVAGQGSSILLPCGVQNKVGLLQWTRDGFGLGPERELVGYDRYTMIGSDQDGNFSLYISPVTLEDDASYQCQVMASGTAQRIRSKNAKVTVLVPPEAPVIVQGPKLRTTAGMQLNLECESNGGKPAAELNWLDSKGDIINSGVTNKNELIGDTKTFNARATLALTPTREHDGKTLVCRSKSAALTHPRSTNITLEVKYAPEVTLSLNHPKIIEFDSVTFTCAAKANPDDVVYTWYRDNVVIPGNHTTTMSLTRLTRDLHGSAISCEVRNAVGKSKASTTLNILFGPKFTTPPSPVAADRDTDVTLTCHVAGNPKPDIVWTFEKSNRVVASGSKLTITGVNQENAGRYRCRATVPGFPEIQDYYSIFIKGRPVVRSQALQYGILGDTLIVECNVRSVPPPIRVRWFHDDMEVDPDRSARYRIEQEPVEDGVRNVLLILEGRESDFGEYNCSVINNFGMDDMTIVLKKQKILPIVIVLACVIGGIIVVVAVTIVIVLVVRRRRKSTDDEEHEPEKQSKTSDRSSNDSDLKVEIRTSSSLSNNDSETWDENSVDPRRTSHAHDTFRYSNDYSEAAFPPKVETHNNNGYVPYVDYQRDYNPPSINAEGNRNSFYGTVSRVDPRYQAAYANPYLRSPKSQLPPPQVYATSPSVVPTATSAVASPTTLLPLSPVGSAAQGVASPTRTDVSQQQYITASQVPLKSGTLATHV